MAFVAKELISWGASFRFHLAQIIRKLFLRLSWNLDFMITVSASLALWGYKLHLCSLWPRLQTAEMQAVLDHDLLALNSV